MTKLEQLIAAIRVLASPADEQVKYLSQIGHFEGRERNPADIERWNIDELGLQFDDAEIFLPGLLVRAEIDQKKKDCISRLGELITEYSGQENADFWTVNGLQSDSRWNIIRQKAQECLRLF